MGIGRRAEESKGKMPALKKEVTKNQLKTLLGVAIRTSLATSWRDEEQCEWSQGEDKV